MIVFKGAVGEHCAQMEVDLIITSNVSRSFRYGWLDVISHKTQRNLTLSFLACKFFFFYAVAVHLEKQIIVTFELCSAIAFRNGLVSDILGASAKLRNATISFMSARVCLPARMEQLGSH